MKWIFVVLVVAGLSRGAPVPEDPLVVVVGEDPRQSVEIINPEQQQELIPVEIAEGNNFRYVRRNFEGGSYQFGFDTGNSVGDKNEPQMFRHEIRREDGTVLGRYGYVDPDGVERVYNYIVDENGYRLLEAGEIVALDVEEPQEDDSANKARLDLEEQTPIYLPAIPEGASSLSDDSGTYGYILSLDN